MRTLVALIGLTLSLISGIAWAQAPDTPVDPDLGERLAQGVATVDHLWVRNAAGAVAVFDRVTGSRRVLAEGGVAALIRFEGRTLALRSVNASSYEIIDLADGQRATVPLRSSERPIAVFRGDGGWTVLTSAAVFTGDGSRWRRVHLRNAPEGWGQPSLARGTDGLIYLGFNKGEWGGGLWSVSATSGKVTEIRRIDDADEPCDGPLGQECDPVTGIVVDPIRPECVIASVGLSHMLAHGRILQVCGRRAEVIFSEEIPARDGELSFHSTWPFFGLAATDDGWLAIAPGKMFRSSAGQVVASDFPAGTDWAGLHGVFDIPGLIILSTDINAAVSLSGYTPLLVPVTD